ncbi:alanine racemase [Atopococcus tabaci]|uniref:alanine racemase n=1 Tax=Atopococcus tabaci TaxID=269774 RepID=UPI00040CB37A|nr:alanine racemase [Atopococcus tabaci]
MNYGSYRSTWAEVNLDHIKENTRLFKKRIGTDTKLMAVIKADGYGHGAVQVGRASVEAGADYLAVAVLDEALELRRSGITAPILQLSPIEQDAVEAAVNNHITLTVFTKNIAQAVIDAAERLNQKAFVHLKVDTGMSRVGVQSKEEAWEVAELLRSSDSVELEGVYTHFADAENVEEPAFTHHQYQSFLDVIEHLETQGVTIPIRHCSNTAATLVFPEMKLDMVRVGMGILGLAPDQKFEGLLPLKQALKVKSVVAHVKTIPAGQSVGYGRTYIPDSERVIATVPIGYADGMPRILSNETILTINGVPVRIAGRVCMDQTMFDVTDVPNVKEGDELIYIGDHTKGEPSPYEIGALAHTTHYEIYCALGKRVPRVYVENGQIDSKKNSVLSEVY